jgi:hypothetical protein
MDQLTSEEKPDLLANGVFVYADPSDQIYYGIGKFAVDDGIGFLGEDFEVGPGLRFQVYLVPAENPRAFSRVKTRCSSTSVVSAHARAAKNTKYFLRLI